MKRREDGEWENGLRGAVVPAPEHRRACAGFSTPVLAVAKVSLRWPLRPLLTV